MHAAPAPFHLRILALSKKQKQPVAQHRGKKPAGRKRPQTARQVKRYSKRPVQPHPSARRPVRPYATLPDRPETAVPATRRLHPHHRPAGQNRPVPNQIPRQPPAWEKRQDILPEKPIIIIFMGLKRIKFRQHFFFKLGKRNTVMILKTLNVFLALGNLFF